MNSTVKIEQVSKSYNNIIVVENVSLDIHSGQIYGLIGPSGAGKTTLVKLIVGMEQADSGSIKVLDTLVPNLDLLQSVGYMAQADALYSDLTAKENLKFFASLFKLNKKIQKERIAYVVDLVNLNNEMNKRVSAFSGGMKRRLSLAVALIQNPSVLILDEPTVGIDPELSYSIWTELIRLKNEEDKTIIVTTHVMGEADKCDHLSMIRDGRIITSGTPNELKESFSVNNLEDVFLKAGGVIK